MTDQQVELSTCPLCDLEPTFAMKTTDGSKLTTQNLMSQGTVRACLAPTVMENDDGKVPALFIIFHKVEDPEFVTAADLEAAADAPEASADPDEDDSDASEADVDVGVIDPGDLDGFEKALYDVVDREGPISLARIQGATALRRDKSLEEVEAAVDWLTERGYIREPSVGEYEVT